MKTAIPFPGTQTDREQSIRELFQIMSNNSDKSDNNPSLTKTMHQFQDEIKNDHSDFLLLNVSNQEVNAEDLPHIHEKNEILMFFFTSLKQFQPDNIESVNYNHSPDFLEIIKKATEKVQNLFQNKPQQKSNQTSNQKPSRIHIRYRNHEGDITKYQEAEKISYIEAYGSSVKFFLTDGTMIISGKNLGYYEETTVRGFGFIKIGRSYIINPAEIDSFNNSDGSLLMKSPSKMSHPKSYKLSISREARHVLWNP